MQSNAGGDCECVSTSFASGFQLLVCANMCVDIFPWSEDSCANIIASTRAFCTPVELISES